MGRALFLFNTLKELFLTLIGVIKTYCKVKIGNVGDCTHHATNLLWKARLRKQGFIDGLVPTI